MIIYENHYYNAVAEKAAFKYGYAAAETAGVTELYVN